MREKVVNKTINGKQNLKWKKGTEIFLNMIAKSENKSYLK